MNELILIIEILITFGALYLSNKLFGKNGLYMWLVISIILASIFSIKTITIFSYEISLGVVLYTSNFICMNILIQKYGPDQTRKILFCSLFSLLMACLLLLLLRNYSTDVVNNDNNNLYINIFKFDLRKSIALIIAYIASSLTNIEVYYQIRKNKNKIWISNLVSSIIVHFSDTILYVIIVYWGNLNILALIISTIMTVIIKYITSLIGTGVIYACRDIGD